MDDLFVVSEVTEFYVIICIVKCTPLYYDASVNYAMQESYVFLSCQLLIGCSKSFTASAKELVITSCMHPQALPLMLNICQVVVTL